jgi:hypothetical protein
MDNLKRQIPEAGYELEQAAREAGRIQALIEAGEAKDYAAAERLLESAETRIVLCQFWLEIERGWGDRPDGYSLHTNPDAVTRYIKGYWDGMPDAPPPEYSQPIGEPFLTRVDIPTYASILGSESGIRDYSSEYDRIDPNEFLGLRT